MKIFDQLGVGQAVQVTDTDFLVCLSAGTYQLPGTDEPVKLFGYNGAQVTVQSIDDIWTITESSPVLIRFEDENGNPVGSLEDYREAKADYDAFVSESEGYGFSDIDREYAVKRRLKTYQDFKQVMSKPVLTRTKVPIKLVGTMTPTGSPFIDAAIMIGKLGFQSGHPYKLNETAVAADEFNKVAAKYPEAKITRGDHSNIRFAKYGGNFFWHRDEEERYPFLSEGRSTVHSTLEAANAREDAVRKVVRSLMLPKIQPIQMTDVGSIMLNDVLSDIASIRYHVREIDSMKKTTSQRLAAINKLAALEQKLKKVYETF